jgi:hypothetical protein
MTGSVRKHFRLRNALRVVLTLASCFVYVAAAAGQKNLEVIDLSSTSTGDQASKARAAFAKGDAIVRMIGGSPADINRALGVKVGEFKAFTQRSKNPAAYAGAQSGSPLKVQAVAAYRDGNGIERSVVSFAPDGEVWRKHLDDWIMGEQSKSASALLGDPAPPTEAWTELYSTTMQTGDTGGTEQLTSSVYRLNTTSSSNDFYMVYTIPSTTPAYATFGGICDGIARCDYHTIERDSEIDGNGATLVDHGPTGTVTTETNGFNVGLGVGPTGPNVSAGFSATWSQPSMVTVDQSSNPNASWKESVTFSGNQCVPTVNSIPVVSTGTFLSRQAAIFQVPGGTSALSFPITTKAEFCAYYAPPWDPPKGMSVGTNYDWVTLQANFPLGPPVLQAFPKSLTIPAGGTLPLNVNAYIPNSDHGLEWTITSNLSWLSVPSQGPFSIGQAVPVRVASNAADGSVGTLSINTSPPFGAPSVATGPILVNVTVGIPKALPVAGILLFGGYEAPDAAEFYDLAGKVAVPVAPNLPRPQYSTATLLNTGNILIAGGMTQIQGTEVTETAELFNPALLTFSYTGALTTARAAHTATLLPDGKVLIVGGIDANNNSLASAELYDPATATFSSAGSLQTARSAHYASVISGPGKPTQVLAYGGVTTNPSSPDDGWELWDEAKNAFISSGKMAGPAWAIPQPVPLSDGVLDLVGGYDGSQAIAQEQLLTLDGPSFQVGASLNVPRSNHTLTALPNGAGLLVTGGTATNFVSLASAEVRDTENWNLLSGTATCPSSPGCMVAARSGHTATLLPSGTVLLVGGGSDGTESYDPAANTFTLGPAVRSRVGHTATLVVTTATSLIATPPSSAFGQSVNLAATVTSAVGTPTGSVHFLDGSTEVGSANLVKGQASIDVTTLSIGSHSIKAVYIGDGVSSASESPVVTQVVGGTTTTTSLSLSPNPSQVGSEVTMNASVSGTGGPVTGSVVFSDDGKQIASADLANGSAGAQVNNLSVGQHPITATYSGNGSWLPSTSATVSQIVTAMKVSTTATVSSNNNPSTSGQQVIFRAQVMPASGTGVPTGTVNFLDGSTFLGSGDLVSGTASFATSSLAVGTHAIVASYLGDSNFSPSNSSVLTQTVSSSGGGKVTPTVDLTVNGSSAGATVSVGDTVTFAARIHAEAGYPWPNGSITISDSTNGNIRYGAANIRKDPNSNDGLATITNSGMAAGSYILLATYGGDNEGKYYNGAQSNTVSLAVNPKLGGPPPKPSVAIDATVGARNGLMLLVTLTVTNNGTAPASGITLDQIALRTLAGRGDAVLFAPTIPVTVGNLRPGASTVVTLELQVPTTIRKLALSENGTLQDGGATVHQFSLGQVVFPKK